MIKLLSFLLIGHSHKWEVINKEVINYKYDFESGTGTLYTLQCKHCGNIKTRLAK